MLRIILMLVIAVCPVYGDYVSTLLDRVQQCVENEAEAAQKENKISIINEIRAQGFYCEEGSDDFRVKFVGLQGVIEHVLACSQALGETQRLVGVITTPAPATPLCARPQEDPSVGLLDASIAEDVQKQLTVRSRAQIVREYLHNGGRLYITYQKGGLSLRTPGQLEIYSEVLEQFPELFDWELNTDEIPYDQIGATYFFTDTAGVCYAFSIKATQAREPRENVLWGIWFGEASHPVIEQRLKDVTEFLDSVNGPTIHF